MRMTVFKLVIKFADKNKKSESVVCNIAFSLPMNWQLIIYLVYPTILEVNNLNI